MEPEVAELRDRLERTVRQICPAWLADRRDDLVQVALVRITEIRRRSEKSRQFSSSYLWRAAHSALIDEIRRLRRRGEVGLDEVAAGGAAELVTVQPGPDRVVQGRELGRELWDCLRRLARPRRMAVTLHLEGYTPAQAAPLLGWKTKKVYNLIHRGLHDLRQCLSLKGLRP